MRMHNLFWALSSLTFPYYSNMVTTCVMVVKALFVSDRMTGCIKQLTKLTTIIEESLERLDAESQLI